MPSMAQRQRTRLVESIFSRRKKEREAKGIPSLFHPVSPPPIGPRQAKPTALRSVERRFPIGLDIGSTSLKWAQLGQAGGKNHVVELGSRPLEVSAGLAEAEQEAQLQEALRQVVSQQRLSGEAVLSLPLEDVTLRLLKMPVLPETELLQAIRWQVEQTLPPQVSYDQLSVDYVVLPQLANQWESRVLVASVPRQRVLALVERVQGAGLTPVAVEIDPFAMADCVEFQHHFEPEETALLIHLGASSSFISVVAKAELVFTRSVLTTGRTLTQAVADQLRVSLEQAETLKRSHGLLHSGELGKAAPPSEGAQGDMGMATARALASPLENMVVDILHAFKSFSHQVTQSQIQGFQRVYLAGGAALLPGLPPWLETRVGASVQLVDPVGSLPSPGVAPALQPWSQFAPSFAIAMGLAFEEATESGA